MVSTNANVHSVPLTHLSSQCCFGEYPGNRMTHCGGDECHFFCLVCAHSNAANEIGLGRYKIKCMDGSGCQAEFPYDEKLRFLNDKEMEALDRNQRETELH